MTADPKVSIVIPCYNGERYVADAIQSALDQTYENREVIVVDDGSTDGSVDVIQSFGDSIRWETGPNRGGCAARNRGLELAHGEWIQFLDADDTLCRDKVTTHLDVANSAAENAVTVSQGQYCDIRTGDSGLLSLFAPGDYARGSIVEMIQTPAPLHRKRLLQRIGGFSEHLRCCQEKDLHLRLLLSGVEFLPLDFVGYTWRWHNNSTSSNPDRIYSTLTDVLWNARRLLNTQQHDDGWSRLFAESLAANGRRLWKRHLRKEALRAFKCAMVSGGGRIPWPYGGRLSAMKTQLLGLLGVLLSPGVACAPRSPKSLRSEATNAHLTQGEREYQVAIDSDEAYRDCRDNNAN